MGEEKSSKSAEKPRKVDPKLEAFMKELKLSKYVPIMSENRVTMKNIRELVSEDYTAMNFKVWHRRKVITKLNGPPSTSVSRSSYSTSKKLEKSASKEGTEESPLY